ncbi:TPA: hypothetical protein ACVHUD_002688 [Legionella anisa]
MSMRKDGNEFYKNCDIGWSVYGENGSYGSNAWITIHAKESIDQQILGDVHKTIEEAEEYIINKAKKWIDDQLKSGALRPIK